MGIFCQFLTVTCPGPGSGKVLSFHVFIFPEKALTLQL